MLYARHYFYHRKLISIYSTCLQEGINLFQSKGFHKVSMYEITAWNLTENLPQVLLDAVKRIQLCELVDPERKLTILSRYTVHSTYVLMKITSYNKISILMREYT